jgi:polysaccharide biosynthesis transport protein
MSGIELLVSIFKRHYLTAITAVTVTLGAACVYLYRTTPLYETSARLMINEQRVSVSELGQALTEIEESRGSNPFATQAELVKSQRVLQRALNSLPKSATQFLPSPEAVSENLRVAVVPATNILELRYRHPNPEQAARVLNAIAEAMVKEDAELINQQASSVRQFLEFKVPQQLAKLEAAEVAESRYRRETGLISEETQVNHLVQGLAALDEESRSLAAQLQEVATRNGLLQQITGTDTLRQAYITMRLGQDEELTQIRKNLLDLETQVVEGRSRLGDQHPDLLALIQQRDEMRTLYSQQVDRISSSINADMALDATSQKLLSDYIEGEVERTALTDRLQVIAAQRTTLQSRLTNLPAKQLQLATLVRQREEMASTLKMLQIKLEEARIAEAQLVSNIRVVGLAETPQKPVVPKPAAVLVIASVAGVALAIGIMLLLENLNNTLRTASEAETSLKLPVLGVLPKLPAVLPLELFLDHSAAIAPYHRLLKTLDLQSQNQGHDQSRVMLFSSTLAEEGKNTVAVRLAAIAAMLGRRTLLINADSSQSTPYPNIDRGKAFYSRDNSETNPSFLPSLSIIQLTDLVHASALPPGHFLSHPSQLLEAPTIQPVILHAREQYDLVIINAPPLNSSADAMTLSQYTDAFVLVVRPEFASRNVIQHSIVELQKNGVSILGIVLNKTPDSPLTFPQDTIHQSSHWLRSNYSAEQNLRFSELPSDIAIRSQEL